MADYILTYDIPNEDRDELEDALTKRLNARREFNVSTFWKLKTDDSAAEIRDALREYFPTIKLYVYEVNPANSATTEPTYEVLAEILRQARGTKKESVRHSNTRDRRALRHTKGPVPRWRPGPSCFR